MPASEYAKVAPALRALKARLLTRERLRELSATASVEDVVSGLRDTVFAQAAEQRIPERVASAMYLVYRGIVGRLAKLAPPRARALALYYALVDEVDDALTLAHRAAMGEPGARGLVTAGVEGTLAWRASQEPEVASSTARMREVAPKWMRPFISLVERVYSETRDPASIPLLRIPARLWLAHQALASLERRGRQAAEEVLCPLLRAQVSVALLEAALSSVQARTLEASWGFVREAPCGVNVRRLARAYAEEGDAQSLLARLRQELPDLALEGRDPLTAAQSALTAARRASRARAEAIYAGYPLHAGLVAAGSTLLRFELEDLRTILLATKYKVHPGDYAHALSVAGVA